MTENEDTRLFVERRWPNAREIDWTWVKVVKPEDVDCTHINQDELAARIAAAKADGWKVI